jgi:multimeric flavodoxin WrbA
MKIIILNGNPDETHKHFNDYLDHLKLNLESKDHQVALLNLRNMDLKYCVGCFDCWIKTPGECIARDDGKILRQEIISSDLLIWASPLRMGYVSSLLKRSMDKSIPLLLPYFDPVNGELHHAGRYHHYPLTGLIYEREIDTDEADCALVENMFARTSLNFRSRLTFCADISKSIGEMTNTIQMAANHRKVLPSRPAPTIGGRVHPPSHLTVFNGSPRGKNGNTPILLNKFLAGYQIKNDQSFEIHDLINISKMEKYNEAFRKAECVLVAFPLYTDSMPASVMAFIETLEKYKGRPNNPAMGFLVQSGFMESAHSRHVEQYLQKLCSRLGCVYLGTIVKGGVEGIQGQPESMTKGLFAQIQEIGRVFSLTGKFDMNLLRQLAKPEQFPTILGPLMKLIARTHLLDFWWDMQLKKNSAFERRYARPYSQ